MSTIFNIFDRGLFEDEVAKGYVTIRRHPSLPLSIANYSPSAQYENRWNAVTTNCRGLIFDDNHGIVARPFRKFFNLGQVELPIQFDTPVEVMDKVDGSLGILYPTGDGYFAIATRGSFASEQAIHATEVWKREYEPYVTHYLSSDQGIVPQIPTNITFLFEIVYPGNRIVLDYGQQDDLVLLGAVQKNMGYYMGPREAASMLDWPGPVVEVMPYKNISEALSHTDRPNAEGFVIRSHNFMVKLKQPDYIELHRLVTNASPKTVWEQLKAGKTKSEIVSAFPDEFHSYIESMVDPLLEAYGHRMHEIIEGYHRAEHAVVSKAFSEANGNPEEMVISRRDYAAEFKKYRDAGYYFTMLDGKSIKDGLWKELRPRETVTV